MTPPARAAAVLVPLLLGSAAVLQATAVAEAGRLRGEARTESRRPVVGATVLAVREQAPPVVALTATDGGGFLALDDVPRGDYSIAVSAPGFEPGTIDSLPVGGPFRSVADIVMRPGSGGLPTLSLADAPGAASVSVRVVGADGSPLESVRIRLDPVEHRHDPVATLSDAAGRARLEGVGVGKWRLSLARAGWTPLSVPSIRWTGGDVTLIARLLPLPEAVRPTAADLVPEARFLPPAGRLTLPPPPDAGADGSGDEGGDGSGASDADGPDGAGDAPSG